MDFHKSLMDQTVWKRLSEHEQSATGLGVGDFDSSNYRREERFPGKKKRRRLLLLLLLHGDVQHGLTDRPEDFDSPR